MGLSLENKIALTGATFGAGLIALVANYPIQTACLGAGGASLLALTVKDKVGAGTFLGATSGAAVGGILGAITAIGSDGKISSTLGSTLGSLVGGAIGAITTKNSEYWTSMLKGGAVTGAISLSTILGLVGYNQEIFPSFWDKCGTAFLCAGSGAFFGSLGGFACGALVSLGVIPALFAGKNICEDTMSNTRYLKDQDKKKVYKRLEKSFYVGASTGSAAALVLNYLRQ